MSPSESLRRPWWVGSCLALLVACSPAGDPQGGAGAPGGSGGAATSGGSGGSASGGGSPAGTGGAAGAAGGSGGVGGGAAGGTGGAPAPGDGGPGGTADAASSEGGGLAPAGSSGCTSGEGLVEGDGTLMAGGLTRRYRVRLPRNYSKDRAWPLVLALHPNGSAGIGFYDSETRPVRKLLEDKAVVILPLARPEGSGWDWRDDLPADPAYFEALITRARTQLCIDDKRIFAMGFSGGASFAGVLACMRTDIRAIAVAGSVTYFDPAKCVGTPAAWIAIGKGELIASRTQFKDFWAKRAGCQTTSTATPPSPCVAYACPAPTPVHYCEHPAGHVWPDFATQAAVDFFAKF